MTESTSVARHMLACWIVRYAFWRCAITVSKNCDVNSRHRLWAKMAQEEIDATAEDYERVIARCHEHGYLDDSRFVARFIASRSRKGYGPARIRRELNQKGISREATEKAMRECDIDWCALARDQATRKYGEPLPTVFFRKVKIQRFCSIVAI